jgi:hypothetical protein
VNWLADMIERLSGPMAGAAVFLQFFNSAVSDLLAGHWFFMVVNLICALILSAAAYRGASF